MSRVFFVSMGAFMVAAAVAGVWAMKKYDSTRPPAVVHPHGTYVNYLLHRLFTSAADTRPDLKQPHTFGGIRAEAEKIGITRLRIDEQGYSVATWDEMGR